MAMSKNPLRQLEDFGQSLWLDYIRRTLLSSAEFRRMLDEDGLKGMTSNPTIFEKAIGGSTDYDAQFEQLAKDGDRVNLPDFGSGLLQLAFAPNSVELAAATQFSVQGALQKWLSGYIRVESVQAQAQDAVLTVTVAYSLLNTEVTQIQTFVYGGPAQ